MKRLLLCILSFCSLAILSAKTVKVSDFKPDRKDATKAIQAALDSGADTVVIDKVPFEYQIKTILFRSNQTVIVQEGVIVRAIKDGHHGGNDCLMAADGIKNFTLIGEGKGKNRPQFIMRKADYQNQTIYTRSEHRHLFPIVGSENVTIKNVRLASSGGDGIYINGNKNVAWSTNVVMENVICDDHHRQGCSIISVSGLKFKDCKFTNTKGTPPACGIDFEPNHITECLENCLIEDCLFANNAGGGLSIGSQFHLAKPVSATIRNCDFKGNGNVALSLWPWGDVEAPLYGFINIVDCDINHKSGQAIYITNIRNDSIKLNFKDVKVDIRGGNKGAIGVSTKWTEDIDGIDFGNMEVKMDKGQELFNIAALGAAKFCKPKGSITMEVDNHKEKYNLALLPKQHPGNPDLKAFKSLPLDTHDLTPVDKIGVTCSGASLRGPQQFLQYAKAGETVELTFTTLWSRPNSKIDYPVRVTDSNGTFVEEFRIQGPDNVHKFKFTAKYDNVFNFAFGSTEICLNVVSNKSGWGMACSKPMAMMGGEGDYYFVVPANLDKVLIMFTSDNNEPVTANLYNANGKEVGNIPEKFGLQIIKAERKASAKDEIWRLHIKGKEDHAVMLGAPITPILYTDPKNILK